MNKRVLTLGLLLVGTAGLILIVSRRTGQQVENSHQTKPFLYGQEDVTRFLKKRGIEFAVVSDVRRNASGNELYVYPFAGPSNQFSVIKISTNGVTGVTAPGRGALPGPEGGFVAWGDDALNGIQFQNGQSLILPEFAHFDIDRSGTYFVVGEKPNRAWLGRVASPAKKISIAEDLLASDVFVSGEKIFVTGIGSKISSSGRTADVAMCLILREQGESFQIVERHSFDWSSGITDVDPAGDRLILWDRALISHTAYTYDLPTKQRHKIGIIQGFEFFLVADLLK